MSLVLTDDEVVAVSLHNRIAWPTPLPTVSMTEDGLRRSRLLGERSLLVRGLLDVSGEKPAYQSEVVGTILAAAEAPRWIAAYVAAAITPGELAGDSTYVYEGASGWLVDMVSPTGVHQLAPSTDGEARELMVAMAENVFAHGIRGESQEAALFVGNSDSPEWVRVSTGEVSVGRFSDGTFEPTSASSAWTGIELDSVLGVA